MSAAGSVHSVHFSGAKRSRDPGRDDWGTPVDLFSALDAEFGFTLDPCCLDDDHAMCATYYTEATDGLGSTWEGHVVYVNPPYSQLAAWLRVCAQWAARGVTVVALVPARTDTVAWHAYVMGDAGLPVPQVRLIRGRLRFAGAPTSAPFPSAVLVWAPGVTPAFVRADKCGRVVSG